MSYTQVMTANFGLGRAGLTTVKYRLGTGVPPTYGSYVTTGIYEVGTATGSYVANVTIPDGYAGVIQWDTGDGTPVQATEPINPGPENLDAKVTTRMATYTQPAGFLSATFPGTIASPTNITAGTITTATNLTNAPTAGDLTAAMKASVTTAATASTPTATVSGTVNATLVATGLDAITVTAPTGVATTFRDMMVMVYRRFFKKTTMTSGYIKTYADDDVTVITTQTASDSVTSETQGAAA